ncbi:hypothetical protein [Arhodomonas sp. AD133]|uniref:hypothetical protein n=1 Tax=Arhodomonas sp. AD133 TaxID=3415009 RepID=UPI003EB6F672
MQGLLFGAIAFGTGGFILSRALRRASRSIVDNLAALVTGMFAAVMLCLVINIEWTLDWRTAGFVSFAYCFFWDRGRMIQEWFPEQG